MATESLGERQKWLEAFALARTRLLNPSIVAVTPLTLPCIGTVKITLLGGSGIPVGEGAETFCALTLNNQQVELRPAPGPQPAWHHSEVLCLASYDDYLRVSLLAYNKWAPCQSLGYADLSLNFLEYYNERATQAMDLALVGCDGRPLRHPVKISIALQYRSM